MPMTAPASNPLLSDRDVDFQLHEVLDTESLCRLPAFADHSRETFTLFLDSTRRFARDVLAPTYRLMDAEPPSFRDGRVHTHPLMRALYPQLVELGLLSATRPVEVGGQQLPLTVYSLASAYLMAANLSAYAFIGLTAGAAHLIEAFGTPWLKDTLMAPMYSGEWTGTMALTEPQAGSSLADVRTRATPAEHGSYRISGSKIFISGGDQDFTRNVVHLTLARVDGAPPGTRGLSLFAIPARRLEGGRLVDNDVRVTGAIHKIGWKGIPSLALNYGGGGGCHGRVGGGGGLKGGGWPTRATGPRGGSHGRRTPRGPSAPSSSTRTCGGCSCARRPSWREACRCSRRRRGTRTWRPTVRRPRSASARACWWTCSRPWPRRSPRRRASRPTPWRYRCTVATATRRSTCPRPGCAIRSSTASTRAPRASRGWICSGARWWRREARPCARSARKWTPRWSGHAGRAWIQRGARRWRRRRAR